MWCVCVCGRLCACVCMCAECLVMFVCPHVCLCALTLPVNTTIASIECLIKSTITSFNTKKGSGSIYNISDIDNTCEGQLIVWSDDNKRLAENKRYKISSTVNKGKLSGLHIEKYKDYPSRISCKTNTLITTIGGLLPLTIFGGGLWQPLGVVIISGLCVSAIASFLLVPVLTEIFTKEKIEQIN